MTATNNGIPGYVFYRNEKFSLTSDSTLLDLNNKENYNIKFLFYLLFNFLPSYLTNKGNRPTLATSVLKNIEITILPLENQQEIANYLDQITTKKEQLQALINAEINKIKIQEQYYKDKFLNHNQ